MLNQLFEAKRGINVIHDFPRVKAKRNFFFFKSVFFPASG